MLTEQHAFAFVVKRRDRQMSPVCPAQDAGCDVSPCRRSICSASTAKPDNIRMELSARSTPTLRRITRHPPRARQPRQPCVRDAASPPAATDPRTSVSTSLSRKLCQSNAGAASAPPSNHPETRFQIPRLCLLDTPSPQAPSRDHGREQYGGSTWPFALKPLGCVLTPIGPQMP